MYIVDTEEGKLGTGTGLGVGKIGTGGGKVDIGF
jgi:hypothetical protein